MLAGRGLVLAYGDGGGGSEVRAVDGVDVEVGPGDFVGILGPSGSGKSSLLYLLAGLKRPTSGRVEFEGRDLGTLGDDARAELRRRRFGFIFQNHFLVNHLTGLENVRVQGEGDGAARLAELGVAHCAGRFPWQMSAGERQRVAIARAVVHGPSVLFADEPTASLDRANAEGVVDCLRRIAAGKTLFVVTHDESVVAGATRILRMRAGRLGPA
jgi:putative ABC transport system ATP-binding protein